MLFIYRYVSKIDVCLQRGQDMCALGLSNFSESFIKKSGAAIKTLYKPRWKLPFSVGFEIASRLATSPHILYCIVQIIHAYIHTLIVCTTPMNVDYQDVAGHVK